MDEISKKINEGLTARDGFNYLMSETDIPFPIRISEEGEYINEMNESGIDFDVVVMLMFYKITVGLNNGELSKEEFNQLKSR